MKEKIINLGGIFNYIGKSIGKLYKFVSKVIKESLTLILTHSTGDNLIDYKIYGNSEQATRSGKNLLDADTTLVDNGFIKQDDGSFYNSNPNIVYGKTFFTNTGNANIVTVSFDRKCGIQDEPIGTFPLIKYKDGTSDYGGSLDNFINYTHVAFTTNSSKIVDFIKWHYSNGNPIWYKNMQVEQGTTATDYEPYGASPSPDYPSEVVSLGEGGSVNVITSGKNLLDNRFSDITSNGITLTLNSDKSITLNGTNNTGDTIFYRLSANFTLPAGTYTLSNSNVNVGNSSFVFYDDNNNFDRLSVSTKTFTSEVTIKPYIRIAIGAVIDNQTIYPMIEQGSTPTDYEPYIAPTTTTIDLTGHEPLRKIGDVSDYVDYDNGKIIRNIGKYEITGAETWYVHSTLPSWFRLNNMASYIAGNGLCNNYKYSINAASTLVDNEFILDGTTDRIVIKDERYTELIDFTSWLATQYSNGTPVIVYYQLATPEEENITLPSIPTVEGTTVISFDNTPEPSNAYAKYYADEEE